MSPAARKAVGKDGLGGRHLGVTPVQVSPFKREGTSKFCQHMHRVKYSSHAFSKDLRTVLSLRNLSLCDPWPAPRSVIVMDSASIHITARIKQMCRSAGRKAALDATVLSRLQTNRGFLCRTKSVYQAKVAELRNSSLQNQNFNESLRNMLFIGFRIILHQESYH